MRRTQRGLALPAVLLVVVLGALAAAGVLAMSRADSLGVAASARAQQSRAMAWSGVQAAMSEMAAQRPALLRGESPELTRSWVLFDEGGQRGIVRLVQRGGQVAQPEAAKLDINSATAEMLAKITGVDEELAGRIVAEREQGRFQSTEELLRVSGITPRMLYGDAPEADASEAVAAPPTALMDLLTVFSFDPQVEAGAREAADVGTQRINVAAPWTDDLGVAINERLGEQSGASIAAALQAGRPPGSWSELLGSLARANLDPTVQAAALDALSITEDSFVSGGLDLTHAPAEVLAAIPGFDDQIAGRLVATRAGLAADRRASVLWPLTEGIVTAEQMAGAIDHLSVRSLQWRVRIEAGMERRDEAESGRARSGDLDELQLRDRVAFEVVIDLTDPRPRLAYFREATLLEAAADILFMEAESAAADEPEGLEAAPPAPAPEPFVPRGPRGRGRPPPPPAPSSAGEPEAPVGPVTVTRGHRVGRWKVSQEGQTTGERSRNTTGD